MNVFIYSSSLVTGALNVSHYVPWNAKRSREIPEGPPWKITGAEQVDFGLFLLMNLNQRVPALLCPVSDFVRRKGSLVIK